MVAEVAGDTVKNTSTLVGPGDLGKEASVLNRDIHLVDGQGITLTADGRHVKVMIEKLQCKHLSK